MGTTTAEPKIIEDQLHLEDFLPYQLSRLSNLVSGGIAQTYQHRHELSVTEWRVIAILGRFTGVSAREVAHKGALDKVAVSRAVNALIDRNLLIRKKAEDDRRRSELRLSAAGLRVYEEIAPAALAFEEQLLEALTSGERTALNALLSKLFDRARAMNPEG